MRKQGLNYTVLSEAMAYDSRNCCNALIETATNTLQTGCKKIYTLIPQHFDLTLFISS